MAHCDKANGYCSYIDSATDFQKENEKLKEEIEVLKAEIVGVERQVMKDEDFKAFINGNDDKVKFKNGQRIECQQCGDLVRKACLMGNNNCTYKRNEEGI